MRCAGLVCAAALVTTTAFAQEGVLRLTLPEAVRRGLDASHRLEEAGARVDAARAQAGLRRAASLPQVAAAASYTRTNHVDEFSVPTASGGLRVIYPDIPDSVRTRIDLQWPIYTGGRLEALTRAAGAEADAAALDRQTLAADLRLEITRAYWAVVTARASSMVVNAAVTRTEAHLRDVRVQLAVGLVPPSDALSVEAQLAHEQMLAIESASILETASADFRRLAGIAPDQPFELVEDAGQVQPQDAPSPSAAVELARKTRADRRSLEFRLSAADQRVTAARAGRLPTVTAVSGYDFSRPNARIFPIQEKWNPSWDVGVSVRWTFFDAGRVGAETAEAAALRRAVEARLKDVDAALDVEVRQRQAELRAARAAIRSADAGVRASAEAHRVVSERFAAGVATNTDVMQAHVALLQAELARTRAAANLQLAGARLERALGTP